MLYDEIMEFADANDWSDELLVSLLIEFVEENSLGVDLLGRLKNLEKNSNW